MIFQRGNPLDYERWAADPGMADWDYAHCLPYFKRMENCLGRRARRPVPRPRRPARARARPGRRTRCSRRSSPPREQAGYPLTDDVNGYRQEGFAPFDRNIHHGRRLSAARRLPASGDAPAQPRRRHPRVRRTGVLFEGTRAVGVEYRHGAGGVHAGRAPARSSCAAARSTRRSCCSCPGVGNAAELRALGIDVVHDLPGVGEQPAGPPRGVHPVRLHAAGVDAAVPEVAAPAVDRRGVAVPAHAGPARPTTSRAAGSSAATTTSPTRT